jgi:sulfur-oxidizing protein SoxA
MLRALAVVVACCAGSAAAQERVLPLSVLRSGITFAGADVRAMQSDDVANPGMLWVERGEKLWNATAGAMGISCASCHGAAQGSMRGVATRYPAYDAAAGAMLDLEARIADCRTRRQQASPLSRESDDLLSLTTYVAHQSRGLPLGVSIDGPARAAFERGRAFYARRHGQMNLACTQCHDQNWGRRLLAQTVSQGHGTAFPAYRLEWQALGSLQRRLRACLFGIRADMPPPGSQELTDLELYLAWRAQGLPIETPGVRR